MHCWFYRDKLKILFKLFLISITFSVIQSADIKSMNDATHYLKVYGYMPEEINDTTTTTEKYKMLKDGLLMFQKFSGIKETGHLDTATMNSMNKQRCGMPERMDLMENKMMRRENVMHPIPTMNLMRRRRWKSPRVLYKITSFPRTGNGSNLNEGTVKREIRRAFKLWENEANLRCIEVESNDESRWTRAHIEISFVIGDHGDGSAFGRIAVGNVAAHAFFPDHHRFKGDIHFDDEQSWSAFTFEGVNLFQTAAHEIGHALGLDHSRFPDSVMHMYLKPRLQSNFSLHEDDIMGIQNLYGKKPIDIDVDAPRSELFSPTARVRARERTSKMFTFPPSSQTGETEGAKVGEPVVVYSSKGNEAKPGVTGKESPNQVLNKFWKCFSLLYDPSAARGATECYTSVVSNLLESVIN